MSTNVWTFASLAAFATAMLRSWSIVYCFSKLPASPFVVPSEDIIIEGLVSFAAFVNAAGQLMDSFSTTDLRVLEPALDATSGLSSRRVMVVIVVGVGDFRR